MWGIMKEQISDKQLMFWYNHCIESDSYYANRAQYAREKNIDEVKLSFYYCRFNPWTGKFKDKKENEIYLAELYQSEGKRSLQKFCIQHKINSSRLRQVIDYLRYMSRINNILGENNKQQIGEVIARENKILINKCDETKQMNFIEAPKQKELIPQQIPEEPKQQETQVFEAQNDLELIISKGVRVIVSPQIDNLKLIKIIELLKDL